MFFIYTIFNNTCEVIIKFFNFINNTRGVAVKSIILIIIITCEVASSYLLYMQPRGDSFPLFLRKIVTEEPRVASIAIKHWQLVKYNIKKHQIYLIKSFKNDLIFQGLIAPLV